MTPAYPAPAERNLITLFTMLGGFMTQLDTTIANVALPHMQATTAASHEQITWVCPIRIRSGCCFSPAWSPHRWCCCCGVRASTDHHPHP
ncbi:MAG: hypothetical protein ABIM50_08605, partial [Novosphingobium sp.]